MWLLSSLIVVFFAIQSIIVIIYHLLFIFDYFMDILGNE